jgi:tetratricopeptide (TPR) repeat protein
MLRPPTWLSGLALCAIAAATFARGVGYGFIWDDHRIIRESARMQQLSTAYMGFVRPSTWVIGDRADSPVVTYRPLSVAKLALDNAVFGGDPRGFHLTNLLLHVGCVLLFWRLLERLALSRATALALSLLFAVHPVGAEAITWINGCSEPICLLFGLITLWLCAGPEAPSRAALAGIAGAACCTLLGKETGIVFLVLALGLLARAGDRRGFPRGAAALALGLGMYLAARTNALAGAQHTPALLGPALAAVPALWFRSLQVVLLPIDLGLENLVAWLATTSVLERALFPLLAAAALLLLGWALWRRELLSALGLGWWLAVLAPPGFTLATGGYWPGLNRWVYVALPGLLLALAPALDRLLARGGTRARRWLLGASLTLTLLLGFEAQRAVAVWENEETLLPHMIASYPADWYAYYMLARHRLAQQDRAGALEVLQRGRAACGPKTKLTCLEGRTLARLERCPESYSAFAVGPDCAALEHIHAWEEIGVCHARRGELTQARAALRECASTRAKCRELLDQLP